MTNLTGGSCDKPACSQSGANRYTDEHGNTVNVCDKHYWQLVTGSSVPRFDSGIGVTLSSRAARKTSFQTLNDVLEERQ